jgi:hypothetical protein
MIERIKLCRGLRQSSRQQDAAIGPSEAGVFRAAESSEACALGVLQPLCSAGPLVHSLTMEVEPVDDPTWSVRAQMGC